jgi:2'-hydroxyisoflavone reductase
VAGMRLLVLGGTEFVGRAVVESALRRGWEVTVLKAARLLRGRAARYVYVSSSSVYDYPPAAGHDEDAPLVEGARADAGQTDYARDKRGGELAAEEEFGADGSLLVRAGLILGPYENVGRLPWWLNRIARGGPVLAPGPRDLPLQYIDVRDLADWTLGAIQRGLGGPYNLASPTGHTTMGGLLAACAATTGAAARLCWTDPQTVLDAGIEPWTELPAWVPPGGDLYNTVYGADVSRALATGLVCRPAAETVADTWAWLREIGTAPPQRPDRAPVGLDPEVEARVLAAAEEV